MHSSLSLSLPCSLLLPSLSLSLSHGAHLLASKPVHTSGSLAASPTRIRMFIAYTHTHQCTRTHIPPPHSVQAKPQSNRSYETWAAWQNPAHVLSPYLSRQCAGQEVRQVAESVTQDEQSATPTLVTAPTLWFIVLNASGSYFNTFSISNATRDSSTQNGHFLTAVQVRPRSWVQYLTTGQHFMKNNIDTATLLEDDGQEQREKVLHQHKWPWSILKWSSDLRCIHCTTP